jgi:N-acyl-D-aspartate/D-glutamate deacylase
MGVTTAVIGNCGFTIARRASQSDREITMRNPHAGGEGMSLTCKPRQGIDWGLETFPEYLRQAARARAAA